MKLQSRLKWNGTGTHRVEPAQQTISRMRPIMSRIGVTRIADSTGLDRLGIPVFSAIRPTDGGMEGISVYNGKGSNKRESLAGAMMEAVERFCGESWPHAKELGTYRAMKEKYPDGSIFDPAIMQRQQIGKYDPEQSLEWGKAWDLIAGRAVMVPLNFITCPFDGPEAGLWQCNTNGLASGNNLEEAICHALAELIERDAYSLALIRAQLAPRFAACIDSLANGKPIPDQVPPDRSAFPLVDLASLPPPLRRLTNRAARQGTKLWLRDIRSNTGIPAFIASFQEQVAAGREFIAAGFGCHPNAMIAASRAITEAAQGRIVQIQGAREDAIQIGSYKGESRVLWGNDEGPIVEFAALGSYANRDILDDIALMLDGLRRSCISSVIVADLSQQDIPASVVKIIIPELENWVLSDFAADKANLGPRGQTILKSSLRNAHLPETR